MALRTSRPSLRVAKGSVAFKKVFSISIALAFFCASVFAQTTAQEGEVLSETQAMLQEAVAAQTDSSAVENEYNSDLSPQQRFEENPKHNIHEYEYKQQVIVGGVVMLCVALAMIANNNYNPKR